MSATHSLSVDPRLPVGTVLNVHRGFALLADPGGTPVTTATVQADRTASITGLTYDTQYTAGAVVSSAWRAVTFRTPPNPSTTDETLRVLSEAPINVRYPAYGATGDGSTNDSVALAAASQIANAATRGAVYLPAGSYRGQDIPIYSNVDYYGDGPGSTVLKLNDSANTDLLVTNGFAGLTGGGTQGGVSAFKIRDMTLDAHRAANSAGWALKIYGKAYRIKGLRVLGGASGGVWSEWGTGTAEMGARWEDFFITDPANNTNNLHWLGPHDSQFLNGEIVRSSATSGGKGIFIDRTKNGYAGVFTNVHVWGPFVNCWEVGRQAFLANCQGEGATAINLLLAAVGSTVEGGMYFPSTATLTAVGVQIGDVTTGVSNCIVDTYLPGFGGSQVPLHFANSNGYNQIKATVKAIGGLTNSITGTVNNNDDLHVVSDGGITSNHSRKILGVAGANIDIRGRIYRTSTTPTIAAAGNFASAAAGAAGATETCASLTATAHASAPAAGGVVTVTFATAWASRTPRSVQLTETNAAAKAAGLYVSAKSTTAYTISCATAPANGAVLTFDVLVDG